MRSEMMKVGLVAAVLGWLACSQSASAQTSSASFPDVPAAMPVAAPTAAREDDATPQPVPAAVVASSPARAFSLFPSVRPEAMATAAHAREPEAEAAPRRELRASASSPGRSQAPQSGGSSQWERDEDERAAKRRRQAWILSLDAVTHAPVDLGSQLALEVPFGLRLSGGYGWVPSAYMNLLTGIASAATGDSYAQALLDHAEYHGHTWRLQAGLRPFRALGLYADLGYAHVSATGSLDLASTGIAQLAALGGGYEANTRLDMWLLELGYQGELADRVVWALALGAMGTFEATTAISASDGAPAPSGVLQDAATQADSALESYGFVPTLTLRMGVDLI